MVSMSEQRTPGFTARAPRSSTSRASLEQRQTTKPSVNMHATLDCSGSAVRLLPKKPCRTRVGDKEWHNGHRAPTQDPSTNNRRLCVGAGYKDKIPAACGKDHDNALSHKVLRAILLGQMPRWLARPPPLVPSGTLLYG